MNIDTKYKYMLKMLTYVLAYMSYKINIQSS